MVAVSWATAHPGAMRVLRESTAEEMVACFLHGELNSERFGQGIRDALRVCGQPETLLTRPDVADQHTNQARRAMLAATRGYGEDRGSSSTFRDGPVGVGLADGRRAGAGALHRVLVLERDLGGTGWLPTRPRTSGGRAAIRRLKSAVHPGRPRAAARGPLPAAHPGRPRIRRARLPGRESSADRACAGGFPGGAECLVGTAPALGRGRSERPTRDGDPLDQASDGVRHLLFRQLL